MSDNIEGILQELEAEQEVNKGVLDKAITLARDLYSQLTGGGREPDPPPEGEPAEGYAEAVAAATKELEEKFSTQLAAERQEREKFAQAYEAERRKRRLAEFGDVIVQDFSQLATGEDFAEALLELNDLKPELYEKFHAVLQAASNVIKDGGLFVQKSKAGVPSGNPFEAEVEKVRREKFSAEEYSVGWVKAMDVVAEANPDLAADYRLGGD